MGLCNYKTNRMNLESNCCGASPLWETDLCSACKEHADFTELENEEQHGALRGSIPLYSQYN